MDGSIYIEKLLYAAKEIAGHIGAYFACSR